MSILAQCPECRSRQSVANKFCSCGCDLNKAKKTKSVKYWVQYYLPGGKKKRVVVGYSIDDARAFDGKIRIKKKENKLFDILPESSMTFSELSAWYFKLEKVKSLASYSILQGYIKKFNTVFGDMVVGNIMPEDLENLVEKRRKEGCADGTIDQEIGKVRAMIFKAFDNNKVGGDTIKKFRKIKKRDKGNASARTRIITRAEFDDMIKDAPVHLRPILMMAYHTGMRRGEILNLTWDKVDMKNRFVHLEAADTKDREKRSIPISDELYKVLEAIPKAIHDQHVYLYKGKPITDLRNGLKRTCKDTGVAYGRFKKGGFVFHDFRHTFNTNMRKAGVPESVIMRITGHSSRSMFDRYNTIDNGDLVAAIEQLKKVI